QIHDLEAERTQQIRDPETAQGEQVRLLLQLKGIGENAAWLLVREFFGWRGIRNRRELASLAGLTPTPYDSGEVRREQGISKAGNRRVRWMMIELAWGWLRYQPDSELSRWYQRRFAAGNARLRKVGIVAVARKLLVALWKYLETGAVPAGAGGVGAKGGLPAEKAWGARQAPVPPGGGGGGARAGGARGRSRAGRAGEGDRK